MGIAPLTTLDTALAGITAIGFDTAPLIYFIERHPSYVAVMRDLFRRVDSGAFVGYGSTITLTEVLTRPFQVHDELLDNSRQRSRLGVTFS